MPNIELKNKLSEKQTYLDVAQLKLPTVEGNFAIFTEGEPATIFNPIDDAEIPLSGEYIGTELSINTNGVIDLQSSLDTSKNIPLYIDINFDIEPTGHLDINTLNIYDVASIKTAQVVDANLIPSNIKLNTSILGVNGTALPAITADYIQKSSLQTVINARGNVNKLFHGDTRSNFDFIANLDFSSIRSLQYMFENCNNLTSLPVFNTSYVTDLSYMCSGCSNLISFPAIDTSNVTNMTRLFSNCYDLTTIPLLDTSKVTIMEYMFCNCSSLTTIPQLDTSKVTNMNGLFAGCNTLAAVPEISTSNVTNMDSMFSSCSSLTSIPLLDTSNVTDMSSMFYSCRNLTTIPQLDTSNVTDMSSMFRNCYSLTTISQLDTSKVTDMRYTFAGCKELTTIPQLDTSRVTNISDMFNGCSKLSSLKLNTSRVLRYYNYKNAFLNCYKLSYLDLSHFNQEYINNSNLFNGCYSLRDLVFRNVTGSINLSTSNHLKDCYHFSGTVNSVYNPNGLKDGKIYIPFSTWQAKFCVHNGYRNDRTSSSSFYYPLEYYTVDGSLNGDLDQSKRDLPASLFKIYYDDVVRNNVLYSLDNGITWTDLATVTPTATNSLYAGDGENLLALVNVSQIKFKLASDGTRMLYVSYYGGTYFRGDSTEFSESDNYILTQNACSIFIYYI